MSEGLIVITGPTASGKTKLAAHLALQLNGEVISADSRQVYKGLDIGSGKDLEEFKIGEKLVPYHLIDIKEPGDKYDVFNFKKDFHQAYATVQAKGKQAILCGGTGMYLEAVLKDYQMNEVPVNELFRASLEGKSMEELIDELKKYGELHNTTDITDRNRTIRALEIAFFQENQLTPSTSQPLKYVIYALNLPREELRAKISNRLLQRIDQGLIEEVKALLNKGVSAEILKYYGLEYKLTTMYILGEISESEFIQKLTQAIQKFAKRQMTWFRRMERQGVKINWLDPSLTFEEQLALIIKNGD